MGFRIKDWNDLFKAIMSIAILIIIIFMLIGFIDWRTALDIIKKKIFP